MDWVNVCYAVPHNWKHYTKKIISEKNLPGFLFFKKVSIVNMEYFGP